MKPLLVTLLAWALLGPALANAQLTCTLSANKPAAVGTPISFRLSCTGTGTALVAWDFGDGSGLSPYTSSLSATHTYAARGTYTVFARLQGSDIPVSTVQRIIDPVTTPRPTHASTIVLDTTRQLVWVVNPDNNSITSIDAGTLVKKAEIPVGLHPRTLAVDKAGQVWVANEEAATLSVISPTGTPVRTVTLPYASRPYGICLDPLGNNVYVTLNATGRLLKLDPATGTVKSQVAVGASPRGIAVSSDGQRILVTRFVSPATRGEVREVAASTMAVVRTVPLAFDNTPDFEDRGRGVPNYLSSVVIAPSGKSAWVTGKKDNVARGLFRDGQPLTFESTVRTIAAQIDLATNQENAGARIDFNDSDLASAVAFSPYGDLAFVALQGNNKIQVRDAYFNSLVGNLDNTGLAPQGIVFSRDGSRLFVQNFMSRTVRVYRTTDIVARTAFNPTVLATISTVTTEKLAAQVLRGKQLFYNAEDPRMAFAGYLSCASCHLDGGSDGRVWDFTQRGEGLRNTHSLQGRSGTGMGSVHWTANFDEIQDFENDIRGEFKGTGFMTDADFAASQDPLGAPKAGKSADLDAIVAYVSSLKEVNPSPFRSAGGSYTVAAVSGRAVFERLGCNTCHAGTGFTDRASKALHDVGTLDASSGKRIGGPLTGLGTPTLKGIWETAPYLHNGSAATLRDVLTTKNTSGKHGNTASLTASELDQLVAYLQQIDESSPNPVVISAVVAPTFSPAGGTFGTAQTVTLASATTGAAIRYTLDGTTPTGTSPAYTAPILVSKTTTIKALATKTGMTNSGVVSATYTIGGGFVAGKTYRLVARHSGKAIDIPGASLLNGVQAVQYDANGGTNQQWKVEATGTGYYRLVAVHSGKALGVEGASLSNGAAVTQRDWTGGDHQQWQITALGDGYYKFLSKGSGLSLDVNGKSLANLASIIQWGYAGGTNQQWKLEPVNVTDPTDPVFPLKGPGLGNLQYTSTELFKPIWIYTDPTGYGSNVAILVNGYLVTTFTPDSGKSPGGILIYDISNPRAPKLVKRVFDSRTSTLREAHAIGHYGNYIALQDGCGVQIWDLADVNNPQQVKRFCMSGYFNDDYGSSWQIFWQAPYLYIANGSAGFDVVDATDIRNPVKVKHVTTTQQVGPLFAIGNLLVTTAHNTGRGYSLFDISNPRDPRLLNAGNSNENMYAGFMNGNRLITSARGNTNNALFSVYDVSDPLNLRVAGQLNIGNLGEQLYNATQDQYIFQGVQKEIVKIDATTVSAMRVVGRGTLNVTNSDHGQVSPFGNLIFVGNDHGSGSGFIVHQAAPDLTGPKVNMVNPAGNAQNRALTTRIGLTMTDNIDLTTVNNRTFIVRPRGGAALAGKYTHQFAILNFSPDQPLLANTTYEIVVPAGGIKDLAGNAVTAGFTSIFSTGALSGNTAPVLAAIGNKTATQGQTVSFTASAADAEGNALSYSLVNAPAGATIAATTGAFTWKPSAIGTFTFAVKVTDSGIPALSDQEQITVTVGPAGGTSLSFYRAINLNGDPVTLDGNPWAGKTALNYTHNGGSFVNTTTALVPAADVTRTAMIRSSVWRYSGLQLSLTAVPAGTYQVYLYVWEDNAAETYSLTLEGQVMQSNYNSGAAGTWKKLGPYQQSITDGTISLATTGGAANFSGVEVWKVNTSARLAAQSGGNGAEEGDLKVFPNPVRDRLTVRLPFPVKTVKVATVTDATGRTCPLHAHVATGPNELELEVATLRNGLYLLKLDTGHGFTLVKFWKQ